MDFARHVLPALSILLLLPACGSSHRLHEYDLTGARVAVVASIPPRPVVFTDPLFDARVDPEDPVGSFFRAGTALVKHAGAREAQARMDSALAYVDVSERIARRALHESARYFGFRPVNHPGEADFILDIRVADYGLVADSWEATVHFEVDAEMLLIDRRGRKPVWKRHVREIEPVSHAIAGLGTTFGNVFTAVALSNLSTEEMVVALESLADFTADRMVTALRRDFYDGR